MPFQVKVPADEVFEGHFSSSGEDGRSGGGCGCDGEAGGPGAGPGMEVGPGSGHGVDGGPGVGQCEDGSEAEKDPAAAAKRAAEKRLADAERKCDNMISGAEKQACVIVEQAKKQAEGLLREAKRKSVETGSRFEKESREKGYNEGYADGMAQHDALINEALQIKAQAEADYEALMSGAEGDALSLVLDIARKVIGEDMVVNRQNILALVQDAFSKCSDKEQVTLKLSPEDYDYVSVNKNVLLSMIEGVGNLDIRVDMSMQPGSCVVETPLGNIDAGVDTKLNKIEEAFYKLLKASAKWV